MRIAAFIAAQLLLASNALADSQPWMKKENPEELGTYIDVASGCPRIEAIEIVESTLIRARIRPLESFDSLQLYLIVEVGCQAILLSEIPTDRFSYFIQVAWGRSTPSGNYLHFGNRAQFIGVGKAESIEGNLRDLAELAITDYLKANFDL